MNGWYGFVDAKGITPENGLYCNFDPVREFIMSRAPDHLLEEENAEFAVRKWMLGKHVIFSKKSEPNRDDPQSIRETGVQLEFPDLVNTVPTLEERASVDHVRNFNEGSSTAGVCASIVPMDREPVRPDPRPRVFIPNVPEHMLDISLQRHFERFGEVVDVFQPISKEPGCEGRKKGIAFVTFVSEQQVNACLAEGEVQSIEGVNLVVTRARPERRERPAASGWTGGHVEPGTAVGSASAPVGTSRATMQRESSESLGDVGAEVRRPPMDPRIQTAPKDPRISLAPPQDPRRAAQHAGRAPAQEHVVGPQDPRHVRPVSALPVASHDLASDGAPTATSDASATDYDALLSYADTASVLPVEEHDEAEDLKSIWLLLHGAYLCKMHMQPLQIAQSTQNELNIDQGQWHHSTSIDLTHTIHLQVNLPCPSAIKPSCI
jgi:hypothetical protein